MSRDLAPYGGSREVAERADTSVGFSRSDLVPADGGERQLSPRAQAMADRAARQECERVLRKCFGPSYEARIQAIGKIMEMEFGKELAEDLLEARMWDGRRIADEWRFTFALNELITLAVQAVNGKGAAQAGGGTSLQARIAEIKKIMASDWPRYRAEGLDVEYGRLLSQLMPEEDQ